MPRYPEYVNFNKESLSKLKWQYNLVPLYAVKKIREETKLSTVWTENELAETMTKAKGG